MYEVDNAHADTEAASISLIELMILKDFVGTCEANNIRYFSFSGTTRLAPIVIKSLFLGTMILMFVFLQKTTNS